MGLSDRQRVDATRAFAILAPFGATLTAAAEAFAARAQILSRTVTFAVLRSELVAAKKADRMSSHYIGDLSHRLARVGQVFDARPVATVESRELDDWLRALDQSPVSRVNFRKVLRTAFEFAVSRGYASVNPVIRTSEVKVDHAAPGILTPSEMGALLVAAAPSIVPALAIAAFAGVRDTEIGRLTWDKVDLVNRHVKIDAAIAKTASRRLIPISKNLHDWLTPYAQTAGAVRPSPRISYPLYRKARRDAAASLHGEGKSATNLVKWPLNALRHSFASYRMALTSDATRVAEECGHSVQIMKQHYRELVTENEAKQWFDVIPNGDASNVVAFARRAVERVPKTGPGGMLVRSVV